MAKTPKKRANTKGAAKKAAPKPARKKVKKPTRSCLAAVAAQEAKKRGTKPNPEHVRIAAKQDAEALRELVGVNPVHDLRQAHMESLRHGQKAIGAAEAEATFGRGLTVEEHYLAEQQARNERLSRAAQELADPKPKKRYRFRDSITGLFIRMRDALRRPKTTERERVR